MGKYKYDVKYEKLFPDLSTEAVKHLKANDLKRKYQEYDLKAEAFIYSNEKEFAAFIPCREDSLDRLIDLEYQFSSEENVEDVVCHSLMVEKLLICLQELKKDEYDLIRALFYEERSEAEYAKECGVSQQYISKKLKNILKKLGILLEFKFF